MAQSLRELLDAQKREKAEKEKASLQTPPTPNVSEPVPSTQTKPIFAGLKVPGLIPAKTQESVVEQADKPSEVVNNIASGKTFNLLAQAKPSEVPAVPEKVSADVPSLVETTPTKAAISADEFTHENQPEKMASDDEKQMKASIDFLVNSFEDPDMLRQAIIKIMTDLQEQPHLVDLLYPKDIGSIVRALRESHAVAITVVEVKGTKRRKKQEDTDEFAKLLEGRGGISI